jgi:hypothetical protein
MALQTTAITSQWLSGGHPNRHGHNNGVTAGSSVFYVVCGSRKVTLTLTLTLTSSPVDKFKDFVRFQSLASELISPRIQINLGEETDKEACNFTASIASA